jgi:hypothetical protein
MDKLKMHTPNLSDEKFAALTEMFTDEVKYHDLDSYQTLLTVMETL